MENLRVINKLPAFMVGGSWHFSRVDIGIWIKQQSMEAIDPANKDDKCPS